MATAWGGSAKRRLIMCGVLASVTVLAVGGGLIYDHSRVDNSQAGNMPTFTPPPIPVPPSIPALPADPKISFYGDELTAGFFAPTEAETFRGIVTAARSAAPITTAQVGIRTGSFATQNPVAPVADLTIVELGTNDVGNTSVPDFAGSYSALIKSVRAANPDSGLLCLGTWASRQQAGPYDSAIRSVCSEHGGVSIQLSPLYIDQKNRGPEGAVIGSAVADNFHPNQLGHEMIGQLVLRNLPPSNLGGQSAEALRNPGTATDDK